jgi:hypothetical protein
MINNKVSQNNHFCRQQKTLLESIYNQQERMFWLQVLMCLLLAAVVAFLYSQA